MQYVGYIVTNNEIKSSRNLWGDVKDLSAIFLPVMEKNDHGDCLCYLQDKGLVDIDACDVRSFVPNPNKDPLSNLMNLMADLMNGNVKGATEKMEGMGML